jgi:thiamine biosynthesis lipoprotein
MVLALHGLSVATSGDYRKFFMLDGRRYSHTIDPRTAMPVANGLASVTVVHPQCMAADAWSTALTVLGPSEGLAMAERHGLAARLVARADDGAACTEWISSAMRAMLDDDE